MFPARIRALAPATLLAAVLVAGVPSARASVDEPAQPAGAINLASYVGCAGGLAIANTPPQAWAALTYCLKMLADEWNRML
jgi:hypothetical protein